MKITFRVCTVHELTQIDEIRLVRRIYPCVWITKYDSNRFCKTVSNARLESTPHPCHERCPRNKTNFKSCSTTGNSEVWLNISDAISKRYLDSVRKGYPCSCSRACVGSSVCASRNPVTVVYERSTLIAYVAHLQDYVAHLQDLHWLAVSTKLLWSVNPFCHSKVLIVLNVEMRNVLVLQLIPLAVSWARCIAWMDYLQHVWWWSIPSSWESFQPL